MRTISGDRMSRLRQRRPKRRTASISLERESNYETESSQASSQGGQAGRGHDGLRPVQSRNRLHFSGGRYGFPNGGFGAFPGRDRKRTTSRARGPLGWISAPGAGYSESISVYRPCARYGYDGHHGAASGDASAGARGGEMRQIYARRPARGRGARRGD